MHLLSDKQVLSVSAGLSQDGSQILAGLEVMFGGSAVLVGFMALFDCSTQVKLIGAGILAVGVAALIDADARISSDPIQKCGCN